MSPRYRLFIRDSYTGPAGFQLGVTRPDATTVGPRSAITQTISGDYALASGQVLRNVRIEGRLFLNGTGNLVEDCEIVGADASPSGETGLVMSTGAASDSNLIRFCRMIPQRPDWRWNGVRGWRFATHRCEIANTTDGFSVFPHSASPGGDLRVTDEGSWVHDLVQWTDAVAGMSVHPSDNKTHNDCIQIHGGRNATFTGTRMDAFAHPTLGSGPVAGSGGRINCCWQIDPTATLGPISAVTVDRCWSDGGYAGQMQVAPQATGRDTSSDIRVLNSRFTTNHGSGATLRMGGATYTAIGNVYTDSSAAVTISPTT